MRMLKRNKRGLYLAKRIGIDQTDDSEVAVYDEPIYLKVNYNPVQADSDTQAFGERFTQIQKAVVQNDVATNFREFDLAYLDGATPFDKPVWFPDEEHTGPEQFPGDYANFRVQSVRFSLNESIIYFERLPGRE